MINVDLLRERWQETPLAAWGEQLAEQCDRGLSVDRFGDIPRWEAALAQLPAVEGITADLDRPSVQLRSDQPLEAPVLAQLESQLRALHPWRKGPFDVCGITIDTEWRSDWKWARLAPHLSSLADRRVLDVGCGNGYHCWRMRGAGASEVIGIDPTPLFVFQFAALQRYIRDPMVTVLPLGIESVPESLRAFDTVFSMGILYHRRSPLRHIQTLRDSLRPGGQLVLETLVVEGDAQQCLTPEGRYARMGNVRFLPSAALLLVWLKKLGFRNARIVDESVTSLDEQRATGWMQFHSLADFLDPQDRSRTIEGYPAPRRAIALAEAP